MTNVLVINSSLNGSEGNSSKLSRLFVQELTAHRNVNITENDLNADAIPHLSAEEMQAWGTAPEDRSEQQQALANISDKQIEQLQAADVVVIGMPMYNFSMPSNFKAWIDRVARAGITFRYTENGPEGLLTGKKVYILAARGGRYEGTALDTQTEYLKNFFAFLGMDDIEFVYAEGLAMGGDSYNSAFLQANEKIIELIKKDLV